MEADVMLLTVPQAAEALGVTQRVVQQMISRGQLRVVDGTTTSDGRTYRYVPMQAVRELVTGKISKQSVARTTATPHMREPIGTMTLDDLFGKQKSP
ncbi:MAG: helix-turn-helix domain-containing protein [Ignavibacteria bacterium]|nr:helix-turn-helix domain-containing protein [Ignavibacteria bacterium]